MFLRRYERKKNGKGHVYWALVESIRTARGSRQKVVAYLGDVKKRQQTGWAALGRRLDKKDRPHPSLFDPPAYPESAEDLALVRIKGVGLERQRDFGDVWLALGLRVRCVTTPDKAQKVLLNRLGLRLPQHLRDLEEVAKM
jgi:hypothetical protein